MTPKNFKMKKPLKKKCKYCGKQIISMYERQLEFNHFTHETTCKIRPNQEVQNDFR